MIALDDKLKVYEKESGILMALKILDKFTLLAPEPKPIDSPTGQLES